jgi:dienelactone hydrolase
LPLVIFSHELGNNHEAGVRYAEGLAAHGYAAYVFDFCGGINDPGEAAGKSEAQERAYDYGRGLR